MRLPQDLLAGTYTKPRLFLCETDKTKICQLETTNMSGVFRFNSYSEIEFTVGRIYDDIITGEQQINPHYNKIEALRLVYLEGFGYFEIQDPEIISDGIKEEKTVTAYSLEYTLSQKYLNDFMINTGEIGSVEVTNANDGPIRPVVLYDPLVPQLSLLHLTLEKIYGWEIGHVDSSIKSTSRTFEVSRASVYDFLTQDVCEKFNCYFVFDTIDNKINVYAESLINNRLRGDGITQSFIVSPAYDSLSSVSINGYKTTAYTYNHLTGEIVFDEAPDVDAKIEIVDGSQEQWMTDIYVTFDNLAQEVSIDYSADDIKTVLTVKGADNLDIREVNFGLPYITDISYYYSVDWMGQDLYDAYTDYLKKCEDYQKNYTDNSKQILEINDHIWYEKNRLSLLYEEEIVNSAVVGTYYVRGGTDLNPYYTEVQLPSEYRANVKYYILRKDGLNETKFSSFYEAIQKYYKSKTLKTVTDIQALAEDFAFVTSYTIQNLVTDLKAASTTEAKDAAVTKFIDQLWEHLGLTPLEKLYYDAYKKVEETNIEAGWNKTGHASYLLYYPVTVVLASLEKAKDERKKEIEDLEYLIKHKNEDGTEGGLEIDNQNISSALLLDNNFTTKQLIRLSSFLREDEYTDDNFIETDSDTIDTLMQTKQELLECGRIELSKLCEPKLQFSMDMANIYALHEFEPIIDQFQLGKIISIKLREAQTKTLQLIGDGKTKEFIVPISFDGVKKITPDYIKVQTYNSQTGKLIFKEPLKQGMCVEITLVKSYVKQSRLLEVDINFDDFSDFTCEFGDLTSLRTPSSIHADLLASALTAGKSVASNASYWDKGTNLATSTDLKIQNGLLGAIEGLYSSDQSIVISDSGILLRKVNEDGSFSPYQAWLTSNNILLSDEGFGQGSTPRMGMGEFTVDGETFYGILAEAVLSGYIEGSRIVGGTINIGNGTFTVDEFGHVTMNAASINGYVGTGNVISSINQSAESIAINANRISLAGKEIDLTSDNISIDSTNFSVTSDGKIIAKEADITGKITASDGAIGGWTIDANSISGSSGNYKALISKSAIGTSGNVVFGVYDGSAWSCYMDGVGKLYASNADIQGKVTATSGSIGGCSIDNGVLKVGNANITSLNASKITAGTMSADRISGGTIDASKVAVTNLNASNITSGAIDASVVAVSNLNASQITAGTINAARIPNISADKITSGTINASNVSITNLDADNITSGTISADRLSSSVITTGNFSSKTLSTSNLTVASGCRLGVASEYNAMIRTVGDYTYLRGFGPDVNYETSFYNLVKYVVQNSSSKDIKSEIHDFDDRYNTFFDKLNPQLFRYNFEPNMGYTMGYVWQDAEQARIESGLERNDIGAITETDSVVGGLALSKQDFIALNTWQIQKLKARVEELENKLAALEA